MIYKDAFRKLGYKLGSPRQDWSAEKADGVCISLWAKEMHTQDGSLSVDTREDGGPLNDWQTKTGNLKRIQHLERALKEFDGIVDVVIVQGVPGESYQSASPWIAEGARANTVWKVTDLDPETGHFVVVCEQKT